MFQDPAALDRNGLSLEAVASTLVYSVLGIIIMVATVLILNKLFGLDLKKELVHDHNTSFGVLIGLLAIAVAIIIAGTILS